MTALARWCHRHRLAVVLVWIAVLLGLGIAALTSGSAYSSSFSPANTDSAKADELLAAAFPAQTGDTATVVWHVGNGSVRDSAVESRMAGTLTSLGDLPGVTGISSPYTASGAQQISADGHTAYASVDLAGGTASPSPAELRTLVLSAQQASTSTLDVEVGGDAIQQTEQGQGPASTSELVGILAAAVVLFAAFGSLFAMALPILTGVAGVGGGLLTIGMLSHALSVADFAPTLGALIGLGVGIDYALFIVTRFRCALRFGQPLGDAIGTAVTTSGRAVLFAGGTVCIALLGMIVLGLGFLDGVALAASVTVGFTVLAALTLLPALLGLLGPRVFSRRERRRLANGTGVLEPTYAHGTTASTTAHGTADPAVHGTEDKRGLWRRWAGSVERRPRLVSLLALLLMVLLAIPTLSLRLGAADSGSDAAGSTTRKAYDLMAEGFGPGINGPLTLAAGVPSAGDRAALARLVTTLGTTPGVASASLGPRSTDGRVAVVTVIPASSPQSSQTTNLIATLRQKVIPGAEAGSTLRVYVGGATASYADFAAVLGGKLPLFAGLITALGFVLLVLAFRCLLVPLTAAVMNLLAAAASFGVVTAFFEWGWGSDALGMGGAGPVEAFLPVMMLAILFGLSMDYQVFLVSRMHEEWVRHRDNARAVKIGQVETSRVITAAATIMICVFCAFAFGGQRVIDEFGIGLAAAVALDAFVVRTVLVPAAMHLLGRANWWLPAWLDRVLPRLHVEADHVGGVPIGSGLIDTDLLGAWPINTGPINTASAPGDEHARDARHIPLPAPRRPSAIGAIANARKPVPGYE
ncbi:MAG TPA: MMPL family transporter [Actinocrinis sp.]|uniref:MMPL family transporter n=1 Tax=Actinocrinis sp. TaxID=1920516 RepID=UPI002DDCE42B|nr:MMPL family transporter [Actinocrinis sp.]HEV2342476.1 MMPL family transporter [Actinocrinis sp.]